jgi:hypothetical protein
MKKRNQKQSMNNKIFRNLKIHLANECRRIILHIRSSGIKIQEWKPEEESNHEK